MIVLGSKLHKVDNEKISFNPEEIEPLLKSIKNNKAVVYVGAGVSISSGFPDWKRLIEEVLTPMKNNKKYSTRIASEFYEKNDFVMAAELIELQEEGRLTKYIEDRFNNGHEPSQIHFEIGRIPFSFAITTNFDNLLEKALGAGAFTWANISDFFKSIKKNEFRILKTHGDTDFIQSYIIKKKDFTTLSQNRILNSHIATFLALNTFLFVGSSLRDPDLLNVLEIAKSIYNDNFGPHYAILFEEEVDDALKNHLWKAYGIRVIQINENDNKKKTGHVVSFLRYLSGKVSNIGYEDSETIALNSETFNFNKLVRNRLHELLMQLGAYKATLTLIDRRDLPGLKYKFVEYKDSPGKSYCGVLDKKRIDIKYYDLIKALYQLGSKEPTSFYIDNLNTIESYPKIHNVDFDISHINPFNTERSLMLTQIFSDGQCIGVLAVESKFLNAFTEDHLLSLKNMGLIISALFRKLELRNSHLRETNLAENAKRFHDLLDSSYLLNHYKLNYLFYEIDYREGRLKAHFNSEKIFGKGNVVPNDAKNFVYDFGKESFATSILKASTDDYCSNIENGISSGKLSKDGVEIFNIKNPVYGTPIRVGNNISFILVAWSQSGKPIYKIKDKIYRIAHLIANSNDRQSTQFEIAQKFINHVNDKLKEFDENKPWEFKIRNKDFRQKVISVLIQSLTSDLCGLARVRLWAYNTSKKKFICIYSYCVSEAVYKTKNNENNYQNQVSDENDEYSMFTINRFKGNPYSMFQHWSMFDKEDTNTSKLNKDPEGKWVVSPIVYTSWDKKNKEIKEHQLVGYISADNHKKVNNKPKEDTSISDSKIAFQKYAIDCISDLLYPIVYHHILEEYGTKIKIKPESKKKK